MSLWDYLNLWELDMQQNIHGRGVSSEHLEVNKQVEKPDLLTTDNIQDNGNASISKTYFARQFRPIEVDLVLYYIHILTLLNE